MEASSGIEAPIHAGNDASEPFPARHPRAPASSPFWKCAIDTGWMALPLHFRNVRPNSARETRRDPGTGDLSPRARLEALGAQALSDVELAALVIGGRGTDGAMQSARAALGSGRDEGLQRLAARSASELRRLMGRVGAARLAAALELGKRAATQPLERGQRLRGPADVHGLYGVRLRHLAQEEFHVLLLDARHRLLRASLVTRGTADTSLVHAREVFREAVREGASGVILVHNHPSGDPRPSPEDRTVTAQLSRAGSVVGIPVLDHVIVGDGRYVSMAEEGTLAACVPVGVRASFG
jgi:DNA repair protein RadC